MLLRFTLAKIARFPTIAYLAPELPEPPEIAAFFQSGMKFLCPRLAKILGLLAVAVLAVALAFRFVIYRHMYIAPEAPYGISDIIEFFLGAALLAVLAVSVLAVVALAIRGPRENRVAAAWLLGVCALIAALVEPLHALAARWAL